MRIYIRITQMNTIKMKKLLLLLLALPFLFSMTPQSNEGVVDINMMGIWRSLDNDFVQISRNMDFEVTFQRITSKKQLVANGKINSATEGSIEIQREYPEMISYTSKYVFSPSGKTLVIMQPDGKHAWVFEKIQ